MARSRFSVTGVEEEIAMKSSAKPPCDRWTAPRGLQQDQASPRREPRSSPPDREAFSPKLALKRSYVAAPSD